MKLTQQEVKQLTPAGIKLAREFLSDAREGKTTELPAGLLTDSMYAQDVAVPCYVEKRTFANRREAGEYLSKALLPLGIGYVNENYPLWSWIGMFFFDCLVNRDENRQFKMGRLPDQAFIFDPIEMDTLFASFNRLMIAWQAFEQHGDLHAAWMLDLSVVDVPDIVDRIIRSRPRFSSNGIVKLVGLLYIDPKTGRPKRNVAGHGAVGGVRRLNNVLDQLYMTYDVYGMRAEQLLALLPEEFKRFNAAAGSARN